LGAVRYPRPAPLLRVWPGWMTSTKLRRFAPRRVTVHASPPRRTAYCVPHSDGTSAGGSKARATPRFFGAARAMLDGSLCSQGSRPEAAAFHSLADEERVRSLVRPGQRRAILGALNPPSSSLAEEERLRSLRFHLLAPLAEAGAWWPLPSSLARSHTKGVYAPSLVQDSGAPDLVRAAARDSRRS
jgi:hypothetical protein